MTEFPEFSWRTQKLLELSCSLSWQTLKGLQVMRLGLKSAVLMKSGSYFNQKQYVILCECTRPQSIP